MSTAVHDALMSLQGLYPEKVDLSLGRLRHLLARLGDPQDRTPPVIHVAGTNGKGSTIAYLRAIMEAAGYKCHAYTSPHLLSFNERIRLAGALISDEYLIEILDEVKAANDSEPITFFEITTAAAFLAFARVPADVVLLETGLGGLNDATNVVQAPLLTVITTISHDHTDWLGRTLPEIALQKAGIMRAHVPCIIGQQMAWARAAVIPAFQKHAHELQAPLIWSWQVEERQGLMHVSFQGGTHVYPTPNLAGAHQFWNAGLAIIALKNQDKFTVSEEDIARGVQAAAWPGRLEHITRGRLAEALPPGWSLWYDGSHNDSAGEFLGEQVKAWAAEGPVHVVAGMLKSKDPLVCLGAVLPHIETLSTFSFASGPFDQTGPSYAADGLAEALKPRRDDVSAYNTLKEALGALVRYGRPGRILVTGTLYAYKELF